MRGGSLTPNQSILFSWNFCDHNLFFFKVISLNHDSTNSVNSASSSFNSICFESSIWSFIKMIFISAIKTKAREKSPCFQTVFDFSYLVWHSIETTVIFVLKNQRKVWDAIQVKKYTKISIRLNRWKTTMDFIVPIELKIE